MSGDILDRIDETLTFYSAGLGSELTVPVERDDAIGYDVGLVALDDVRLLWGQLDAGSAWVIRDETHVWRDFSSFIARGHFEAS